MDTGRIRYSCNFNCFKMRGYLTSSVVNVLYRYNRRWAHNNLWTVSPPAMGTKKPLLPKRPVKLTLNRGDHALGRLRLWACTIICCLVMNLVGIPSPEKPYSVGRAIIAEFKTIVNTPTLYYFSRFVSCFFATLTARPRRVVTNTTNMVISSA